MAARAFKNKAELKAGVYFIQQGSKFYRVDVPEDGSEVWITLLPKMPDRKLKGHSTFALRQKGLKKGRKGFRIYDATPKNMRPINSSFNLEALSVDFKQLPPQIAPVGNVPVVVTASAAATDTPQEIAARLASVTREESAAGRSAALERVRAAGSRATEVASVAEFLSTREREED